MIRKPILIKRPFSYYHVYGNKSLIRIIVESDICSNEFIKMGLKDKVIQILNK